MRSGRFGRTRSGGQRLETGGAGSRKGAGGADKRGEVVR